MRLLIAGNLSNDEAESLIGYAIDDLRAKGLAPDLPRPALRKALAETQLDALARFEERDDGKVKLSPPEMPKCSHADKGWTDR